MAYADYDYYKNVYGGNAVGADDFTRLANAASQYINAYTMGRAASASGDTLEDVKMCMCQVVDVLNDEMSVNATAFGADQTVSSETNGSWSISYSTRSVSGTEIELLEKRKRDALLIWLGGTGLLAAKGHCAPPRGRCWP